MQPFKMKVTQDMYELMNCFESNILTDNRLVGPGEGMILIMIKDREIHSISDAQLDEQQIISMVNYMSRFMQKLTGYSTELMKRRG